MDTRGEVKSPDLSVIVSTQAWPSLAAANHT